MKKRTPPQRFQVVLPESDSRALLADAEARRGLAPFSVTSLLRAMARVYLTDESFRWKVLQLAGQEKKKPRGRCDWHSGPVSGVVAPWEWGQVDALATQVGLLDAHGRRLKWLGAAAALAGFVDALKAAQVLRGARFVLATLLCQRWRQAPVGRFDGALLTRPAYVSAYERTTELVTAFTNEQPE